MCLLLVQMVSIVIGVKTLAQHVLKVSFVHLELVMLHLGLTRALVVVTVQVALRLNVLQVFITK